MDQPSLMICVFCFGQFLHYSEKKLEALWGKKLMQIQIKLLKVWKF
jgi:hypothetical protein